MTARDRLGDFPDRDTPDGAIVPAEGRKISNIVMMGMGEPLYNFEAVKKALLIASDGDGLSLSKRRITLSTSGVVPEIYRTGEEIGVMLAISLHATNDDLRDMLVPINKKYPLKELIAACRAYPGLSNAKRITFEYVMLKDVNDSLADARELVKLLKGIPAKINLIPFNPWPGNNYQCSDWETIEKFSDYINAAGYASPIRTPARPRHSRRLRPAQVGLRAHEEDRPPGTRGDDDRGARRSLMTAMLVYLGRFLVLIIGYAIASLAASLFLNVLLFSAINPRPEETLPVVVGSMVFSVPFFALFVAYFAFIPAVPAMLLGEVLGKRDWLFYALAGAVVAAVVIGMLTGMAETGQDFVSDPSFALAIIGSGLVGGMAYWLVAGRSAGRWREATDREPISPAR